MRHLILGECPYKTYLRLNFWVFFSWVKITSALSLRCCVAELRHTQSQKNKGGKKFFAEICKKVENVCIIIKE